MLGIKNWASIFSRAFLDPPLRDELLSATPANWNTLTDLIRNKFELGLTQSDQEYFFDSATQPGYQRNFSQVLNNVTAIGIDASLVIILDTCRPPCVPPVNAAEKAQHEAALLAVVQTRDLPTASAAANLWSLRANNPRAECVGANLSYLPGI